MIRRFAVGVGVVLAVLVCLPMFPPLLKETIYRLPTGWVAFLSRTLPDMSLNWAGLGMVALCSAIILVCLHSTCRWLYRTVRERRSPSPGPERWPLRWTVMLFAAFWLLFAVVLGAAGLGRQVTWVLQTRQPLYTARHSGWSELKQARLALTMALDENEANPFQAQAVFMKGGYESVGARPRPTLWEQHHVLLFTNAHGECVGSILIPRNPPIRDRIGFLVNGKGMSDNFQPMTNLPTAIAELEKLSRQPGRPH